MAQGPEGTHKCLDEKQLHLFFLCFCAKAISFLGSVMRCSTLTIFYPILSPHLHRYRHTKLFFQLILMYALKCPSDSGIMHGSSLSLQEMLGKNNFSLYCTLNYFQFFIALLVLVQGCLMLNLHLSKHTTACSLDINASRCQ